MGKKMPSLAHVAHRTWADPKFGREFGAAFLKDGLMTEGDWLTHHPSPFTHHPSLSWSLQ